MRKAFVVCAVVAACVASGVGAVAAKPAPKGPPVGATDHTVTDANLSATICIATNPSVKVRAALRAKVFAAYRIPESRRSRYVLDLLVPANLGGAPSLRNLWPQLRTDATAKDSTEELLHSLVCSGLVDLSTAQHAITTDWTTAATSAQQVADARKAAVGAYLAAQAEAEQQRLVGEYLASLPPPTTAPPETAPPVSSSRVDCVQLHLRLPACAVEGEVRCAESGTPVVCTPRNSTPEDRALVWRPA